MTIVLDSSAILAWLLKENGADAVAAAMPGAVVAAVNVAEVADRLHRTHETKAVHASLALGLPPTIPIDRDLAVAAGLMRADTHDYGLSLGDLFCLALARRLDCPVLTADRAWAEVAEMVGVEVWLIR